MPRCKPITKQVLDRAIRAEEDAAAREHQVQKAWFDCENSAVMLELTDGRVFGAETQFVPCLQGALPQQLETLRALDDGVYLIFENLDLYITVDRLVTRVLEGSLHS